MWEKCPGVFTKPKAVINDLDEGKAYKFRVKAQNTYGLGEPLETEKPIVVKPPYSNELCEIKKNIYIYRKRLNKRQPFFHACTIYISEANA